MRFKLIAEEDSDTGEIGWLRSDADRSIYGPLGVDFYSLAHDLLEHAALRHVGDEMEAHGALWYVRGPETGWCSKYGNVVNAKNIGEGDWIPLYNAVANQEGELPWIAKQPKIKDPEIEQAIQAIIRIGTDSVRKEMSYSYGDDDDNKPEVESHLNRIANAYADYFRRGYRRAKRRYRNCPDRAHLFNTVFEKLKHNKPEFEGQQLEVVINLKECRVSVCDVTEDAIY